MDYKNEFARIMAEQNELALATCAAGTSNVRIVNYCCDASQNNVIYFSTFEDNEKIAEFAQNPAVAFTTVPHVGNAHVRVKNAIVKKSGQSVYDLKEEFVKKTPDYGTLIDQAGEYLVVFEVHFKEAKVTVDLDNSGTIAVTHAETPNPRSFYVPGVVILWPAPGGNAQSHPCMGAKILTLPMVM